MHHSPNIDELELVDQKSYGVSTLGKIREALFGYSDFSAVVRELIQNADDAGSCEIKFYFYEDCLVVENQSVFSEEDFDRIRKIASGRKRADAESTGTFGVGFISVYQLTDYPELSSSGYYAKFDPTRNDIKRYEEPYNIQGTRFRFEYRRAETKISSEIEQQAITMEQQAQFVKIAQEHSQRDLIFLRNINSIEIYEEDNLICQTTREKDSDGENSCELIIRQQYRDDESLTVFQLYEHDFSDRYQRKGKKSIVAIAYPLDLKKTVIPNGLLYNFLPTHIKTGFNFLINGDFYPTNDRKSILLHTESSSGDERCVWNRSVIDQVAELVIQAVEDLKQFFCPKYFYECLPLRPDNNLQFLGAIKDRFMEYAKGNLNNKPHIVYSSQDCWQTADDVKLVSDKQIELQELLIEANVNIVHPDLISYWNFFSEAGVKQFTITNLIQLLSERILKPIKISDAETFINTRQKLYRLYDYLQQQLKLGGKLQSGQDKILQLNIFLSDDGTLCSLNSLYLAREEERNLLSKAGLSTIDVKIQEKYYDLLCNRLGAKFLDAQELIQLLRDWANNQNFPCPMNQCHPLINTPKKISRVLQYLNDARRSRLPLCLGMDECVYRCGDSKIYYADFRTRDFVELERTNYTFLNKKLQGEHGKQLIELGCQEFQLADFVNYLEKTTEDDIHIDDAPFSLNSVDMLCDLYSEIERLLKRTKSHSRQYLIELIKGLPIYLSEKGRLRAITDKKNPLFLTAEDVPSFFQSDNRLSPKILDGNLHKFFEEKLSVEALDDETYIKTYVTQDNYEKLDDSQKSELLDYVRITDAKSKGLSCLAQLRSIRLIHCVDGKYRKPNEVFFPSQLLDSIFTDGYSVPHREYKIPKDEDKQKESHWLPIFNKLGVKSEPQPKDLLDTIVQIVKTPPTEENIERLRPIYKYLNENWEGKLARQDEEFARLKSLKWLPTENDRSRYYVPSELYPARLRALAKTRGKFLSFSEPNIYFRDFLKIPKNARTEHIVGYLLDLSNNPPNEDVKPNYSNIYRELNNRLENSEDKLIIKQLSGESIIWDDKKNKFWEPNLVFMKNFVSDFGPYRGYLEPKELRKLLRFLGVKETASAEDYVELIEEIALLTAGKSLTADQRSYIKNAYRYLEKCSDGVISLLKDDQSVLGKDQCLHKPEEVFIEDKTRPLEYFDKEDVPLVADGLGEELVKFLHKELGVQNFSRAVSRQLVDFTDETLLPGFAEKRILQRKPALQRCIKLMIEKSKSSEGEFILPNELDSVDVYGVHDIKIQYSFRINEKEIKSRTISQGAFYDRMSQKLYIQQTESDTTEDKYLALATEMITLLNPELESPPEWIPSQVFQLDTLEDVDRFLDQRNFPSIQKEDDSDYQSTPESDEAAVFSYDGDDNKEEESIYTTDNSASVKKTTKQDRLDKREPDFKSEDDQNREPSAGTSKREKKKSSNAKKTPATQTEDQDKKPQTDSGDAKPPTNKAQKDRTIPPFHGNVSLQSPRGRDTQWWELMDTFDLEDEFEALQDEVSEMSESEQDEEKINKFIRDFKSETPVHSARFVLKYVNVFRGFLPLTTTAQRLLLGRDNVERTQVTLYTYDESQSFPLYIDWKKGIMYNQDKLVKYFQAELHAGAIVYLKRRGNTQKEFILHFNRLDQPKVVKEVQILFSDDGEGTFKQYTIKKVEVSVETEEMIFRGEKRFEDQYALWLASVGRKNTFETIIDVLEGCSQVHLYEIFARVFLTKMVSSNTVYWQLEERDCFVNEGSGYYSLDLQGLAKELVKRTHRRKSPPPSPQSPTTSIPQSNSEEDIQSEPEVSDRDPAVAQMEEWQLELQQFLEKWISRSINLRKLTKFLREAWSSLAKKRRIKDEDLPIGDLIESINIHPDSAELARKVTRFLNAHLTQFEDGKGTDDDVNRISMMFSLANEKVRERHLLPPLRSTLTTCQSSHDYESAEMLAQLLKYDSAFDNEDFQQECESWELYLEAQDETELDNKLKQLELVLDTWKHKEALHDLEESLFLRVEEVPPVVAELMESNPDEALRQFEQVEGLCERFARHIPHGVEKSKQSMKELRRKLQQEFYSLAEDYKKNEQDDVSFRYLLNASSLCSKKRELSSEDAGIMLQLAEDYHQRNDIERAILVLRYLIENRVPQNDKEDAVLRSFLEGIYYEIELWDECAEIFDGRLLKGYTSWRVNLDQKIAKDKESICEMHELLASTFESIKEDEDICRILPQKFLLSQIEREKQKSLFESGD